MPIREIEEFFGTEHIGLTIDERLGNCYQIAGYALTIGTAPQGTKLIHGSMHHVRVERRINHAWLELPSCMIWEPISGAYWTPMAWSMFVRPRVNAVYDYDDARKMILTHMHWGPWSSSGN